MSDGGRPASSEGSGGTVIDLINHGSNRAEDSGRPPREARTVKGQEEL